MSAKLNRYLVLERPVRSADGAGGYTQSWEILGALWASVKPGRGAVRAVGGVAQARVPLTILVRSAPVGSPRRPVSGQRFREGTRVFAVLAVADSDDGRFVTCTCQEEEAT
jgi:head-tail adaptor